MLIKNRRHGYTKLFLTIKHRVKRRLAEVIKERRESFEFQSRLFKPLSLRIESPELDTQIS